MTQQNRFLLALRRLQDWHADSMKARDYNTPGVATGKASSSVLRRQYYPGTASWWATWRRTETEIEREAVIRGLEAEYEAVAKRPTRIVAFRDAFNKTRYRVVAPEGEA